jgi:hypothetical protein
MFSLEFDWTCSTSAGCLHPFAAATHIPTVALPTGLSERIALFSFCVKRDCKLYHFLVGAAVIVRRADAIRFLTGEKESPISAIVIIKMLSNDCKRKY